MLCEDIAQDNVMIHKFQIKILDKKKTEEISYNS